jgi:hypothetical protein
MLDIIAAMDGLPREIEEEIFKCLADDSTSIAQLQRVNKKFASDQFLWRLLLAKSCSGYKAPSDCSLEAIKGFVRYLPRKKFSSESYVTPLDDRVMKARPFIISLP